MTLQPSDQLQLRAEQERVAQLEAQNHLLEQRDRILAATTSATNALLTIDNFNAAVNTALQIIGESLDCDRVTVIENFDRPSEPFPRWRVMYEWISPFTVPQLAHSDAGQGSYAEIQEWYALFSQGQPVSRLLEEMPQPHQSEQAAIGVKSYHLVPTFVEGKLWGVVGLDDCREAKRRSPAEIALLKTAAACIGSAIQRDRIRREREAAERALLLEREQAAQSKAKLLDTVATVANLLLRSPDYNTVLPDVVRLLGEAVGSDRCCITQDVAHPETGVPAVRILMEWCQAGVSTSIDCTPDLETAVSWEDFAQFRENHLQGVVSNYLIADLQEPTRSIFLEQSLTSILVVPILVKGQSWGQIGFDNCGEPRLYDEAEIAILKIAADSIAAAIERDRIQKALLQAEQERSHLLKTVTTVANQLLRSTDYTTVLLDVLKILGKAASADRCSLVQNVTEPHSGKPAARMHTEWCRNGFQPSISYTPDLETALPWEIFSDGYTKLSQGETLCVLVDDLAEPVRSLLLTQGNVSILLVPIVVQGEFWGVFGFDYCQIEKSHDEATQVIFAIAVDSIAAAIERQRTQTAILQAEQARAQELERLNAQLQQSEERYRLVTLATKEAICDYNIATQQIDWYEGSNSPFGHTAGQPSRGVNLDWWLSLIHPDDRDRIEQQARIFFEAATDRWYNEYRFQRADGTYARVLDAGIKARDAAGQTRRVLGAVMDITAQREAEAALHAEIAERRRAELVAWGQREALTRSVNALTAATDLDEFLSYMLTAIAEQLQATFCALVVHDRDSDLLSMRLTYERGQIWQGADQVGHPLASHPFPATPSPFWQELTRKRRPIFMTQTHPLLHAEHRQWMIEQGIGLVVAVPLLMEQQVIGWLSIRHVQIRPYQPAEIELVQALAQYATLALQLAKLTDRAKQAAVLEERNRMARDIHDSLAQAFTGIIMQLEAAKRTAATQPETAQSCLDRARSLAASGLAEARRSVRALRPEALESDDLPQALRHILEQMTSDTQVRIALQIEGTPRAIPTDVEVNLLRIGQEAITNALRYANAQNLRLNLVYETALVHLQIRDDGEGFDPHSQIANSGFGLVGMQERSRRIDAQFRLASHVGQGTEIVVTVPI